MLSRLTGRACLFPISLGKKSAGNDKGMVAAAEVLNAAPRRSAAVYLLPTGRRKPAEPQSPKEAD
jgi:hypothetical protein